MTTTAEGVTVGVPARLVTRPLLVRFVSIVGTATSFYLLLSAVPLYARDRRGLAVLLAPGVLTAAAGMLTLSLAALPLAMIAGAAMFGMGFGVTQNVTQSSRCTPGTRPPSP